MHFLDLPGARALRTPGLLDTTHALTACLAQRAMLCLYGASGVGKTFAVRLALAGHPPDRHCRLDLRAHPEPTDLRAALHHALHLPGDPPSDPGVCDASILDTLTRPPRIVVVDDAHQLSPAAFEYLRYLYDTLPGGLCIVLIAGEDSGQLLRRQRMLASRTAAWVEITPLLPDHVPQAISRLHPIWRHTDHTVLRHMDARFAHGRLRRWAALTHHTRRAQTFAHTGAVTPELLERIADRIDPPPRR
ncbi:ATP-binding protein (plasmid) [Embleya sp. NBC_00888]|uniref:ATP-binding protein n=1 Tax=Embleya sp. NBC_00888 TaxID=2975960 RepID=UPI002F913A33|nr:ATP-binding protein [Embleya sp. NBC_00888]WSY43328.1 ATP-binding protein [Embleya sp. NBC_00888]WSY43720.1 ATP-binding protein [Embleya sp. NBC_00888]WSY48128.1 ATP-binding protein [Embleya sp. NBC_00888]